MYRTAPKEKIVQVKTTLTTLEVKEAIMDAIRNKQPGMPIDIKSVSLVFNGLDGYGPSMNKDYPISIFWNETIKE